MVQTAAHPFKLSHPSLTVVLHRSIRKFTPLVSTVNWRSHSGLLLVLVICSLCRARICCRMVGREKTKCFFVQSVFGMCGTMRDGLMDPRNYNLNRSFGDVKVMRGGCQG